MRGAARITALCALVAGLLCAQVLAGPDGDFAVANRAYSEGDFSAALRAYERSLAAELHANGLCNLGNTCFRLGKLGPAALSYERALVLQTRAGFFPHQPEICDGIRLTRLQHERALIAQRGRAEFSEPEAGVAEIVERVRVQFRAERALVGTQRRCKVALGVRTVCDGKIPVRSRECARGKQARDEQAECCDACRASHRFGLFSKLVIASITRSLSRSLMRSDSRAAPA